ncbi:pentatricopeptide repeat-containing protein At1g25360-like [Gossypium hirsutum]|uniref:Pentatricopeptide repeat-containing protein At1g25360-like n=1 Tax=Gossypium hirsutum TaxID=3635 RepID=A0ABM2YL21_GOSHI|nr:pentatricopeptide repeat-containing protein At1g25360-like [Gossypium hirsutum]
MQLNGIEANEFTLTSVILACVALDHRQALKICSLVSDAEISWNLLIQASLKANDYEMIHKLLRRIQSCFGYLEPISVCDIFRSCSSPVLLNMGMQAQAYMTKRGLLSHPTSGNGLIQMYSGCGQIAEADLVFESMPEKSSLCWTSIISAKVEHGHPSEALTLFNEMRRRNKLVDSSTLKSILKACSQMGRVDKAHSLLMSMEVVYGVKPSEEHYSCVIEAFTRAGMLEELENFIDEVVVDKNDTKIWNTLLSSARVIGKWKDASKTKTLGPNSSCIEVQNKIFEFVSDQKPSEDVFYKLAEIEREMEELGYVEDRNHLLHDAEEEEYDGAGLGHTEMKAIAFGLLSLPHRTPVRVIKSVRMCEMANAVVGIHGRSCP